MKNYTQIKSSCKINHFKITDKFNNLSNIAKKSSKNMQGSITDTPEYSSASLVNREIRKPEPKINTSYIRYFNKHIAQYALTVGNISDNELEKRRQKKNLNLAEFIFL